MLMNESSQVLAFLKPFAWITWVAFLFLLLAFSVALTFISWLSKRMNGSSIHKEDSFNLLSSIWYFCLISIQLGADKHPSSIGGKILMFTWSSFTLILLATYTANLAAYFTNPEAERPLTTIEDIVESDRNATTYDFFRHVLPTYGNRIFDKLHELDRINYDIVRGRDTQDQIKDALQSGGVMIAPATHFDALKSLMPNLYVLDGYFTFTAHGFVLRNDSQFANETIGLFVKYGREGYFHDVRRKHESNKDCASKPNGKQAIGIDGFREVITLMMIAALGAVALSSVSLLWQNLHGGNDVQHLQFKY